MTSVSGRWVRRKVSRQRCVSSHLFQARTISVALRNSHPPRVMGGLERCPQRRHELIDFGLVKERRLLPIVNRKDRCRTLRRDSPDFGHFGRARAEPEQRSPELLAGRSTREGTSPTNKPANEGPQIGKAPA